MLLSYPKWSSDGAYLDSALKCDCLFLVMSRMLVQSKRLGTAYSLVTSFPPKFASASAEVLEEMLQAAVTAKDRKRVGMMMGC